MSSSTFQCECPVCKSVAPKRLVGEYRYDQVANYFCPISRNKDRNRRFGDAIRRLWKQDTGYSLVCENCSFGFGYPFVGGDDAFYQIIHEQNQYPENRWEYDLTLTGFFKNKVPEKVLDIGAGAGYFLDKIEGEQKFAMEGSETTREMLRKKGIKVYTDQKKIIEENRGTFDYITMFQVLEHVAEFEDIFYLSNQLLRLNGSLIISVPDCSAMILQEKLTGYPDIFPIHINKWTPRSLTIALEKYGFKIADVIYEPASVKKFFDSVYLKILHKATLNGTIANSIYKIQNKKIRVLALAFYSVIEVPALLINYKKLDRAGSFLMRAEKVYNSKNNEDF
jgi:2-polyprenyl-3-methyl-5-hydroxy-6-metoxy-1,4-benzoquinol methylase